MNEKRAPLSERHPNVFITGMVILFFITLSVLITVGQMAHYLATEYNEQRVSEKGGDSR